MHRSGNDFQLILELPKNNIEEYKFIVDGRWCINEYENYINNSGNINNYIDLNNYKPIDEEYYNEKEEILDDDEFVNERITRDKFIDPPPLPLIYRNIPIGKAVSPYPQRQVPHNALLTHLYCSIIKEVTSVKGLLVTGCVIKYKQKYSNIAYYTTLKK